MLPQSRSPQIIRLHSLQQNQRDRYINNYLSTITDLFPSAFKSNLFSHPCLKNLLPDLYFTFITICICKRRLGQQYTYVTMYKDKHYEQQGVLVNKKYRLLVFLLQILGRNFLYHFVQKAQTSINSKIKQPTIKALVKCIGNSNQIFSNLQWFFMMLFMLNVTKSPNIIDIKLGLSYVYTFFNQSQTKISYKFQGMLLLCVFVIKFINFFFNLRKEIEFQQEKYSRENKKLATNKQRNKLISQEEVEKNNMPQQQQANQQLCRICYDQIRQKSCTKCGHIFCWECIIKSLQINTECPVCRTKCLPREVIQLVNY